MHARNMRIVLALAVGTATGCSDTGMVELAWLFVDEQHDPIYPGSQFSVQSHTDSCGMPGHAGDGSTRRSYDLHVELRICDQTCPAGCDDPSCMVIDALQFACDTSRGSNRDVPASDVPYRFTLGPVLVLDDGAECRNLPPSCISAPGPRERLVRPGLTTDLQVYEIALDVQADVDTDDPRAWLDLEACGCV